MKGQLPVMGWKEHKVNITALAYSYWEYQTN